jgi:catalase
VPAIQAALSADPPESYATVAYNSIHAFKWIAPDGTERWVRYRFEPEEGERTLSDEAARELGRDYLKEEIVARESTAFRLVVIVAGDGDDPSDPTVAWPDDRERVEVGRLELTGPDTEREQGDDILVFDPTRVTGGIELSDDRILRFRPRAYATSVTRRTGAPAPAGVGAP